MQNHSHEKAEEVTKVNTENPKQTTGETQLCFLNVFRHGQSKIHSLNCKESTGRNIHKQFDLNSKMN